MSIIGIRMWNPGTARNRIHMSINTSRLSTNMAITLTHITNTITDVDGHR